MGNNLSHNHKKNLSGLFKFMVVDNQFAHLKKNKNVLTRHNAR